jgi:hypothetical protein
MLWSWLYTCWNLTFYCLPGADGNTEKQPGQLGLVVIDLLLANKFNYLQFNFN